MQSCGAARRFGPGKASKPDILVLKSACLFDGGNMEAVDIRSLFTLPIVMTILVVSIFLLLVPVIKVFRRTAHHPLWGLFAIFPGLNLIALWLFAFKPWPTDK